MPRPHSLVGSALLALVLLGSSGCYDVIIDAVVDDETNPGGTFTLTMGSGAPTMVTAVASGDPLTIIAESPTLVASMTCGEDKGGNSATIVLGKPGAQITLDITTATRSKLQAHAAGQSCVSTSGTLTLTTGSDTAISGTFSTTGHLTGKPESPCAMTGTLTEIPQMR